MGVPFTPQIQWSDPYLEQWSYLTDIFQAADDSETRRLLKIIPDRQDSYTVLATDPRRAGFLEGLMYTGQLTSFTVPYWPDVTRVAGLVSPGSGVVVTCDTTDRDFVVGGKAILYQDEWLSEEVSVTGLTSTTVTLATVTKTYTLAKLIPGRLARLADSQHSRPGVHLHQVPVTFDYEKGQNPAVARASLAVFNVAAFNRNTDPPQRLVNSRTRVKSDTNDFKDFARGSTPLGSRTTLPLYLDTRAKVKALRTWFHSVRGRYTSFWLPTYQMDLQPVDEVVSGVTSLTIQYIGYTAGLFPLERYRHLAFITHAGVITHRRVTDSVDNGNGTETLTLSGSSGGAINVLRGSGLIAFMLYCRLASDSLTLRWSTAGTSVETTLEVVELPRETPTTT